MRTLIRARYVLGFERGDHVLYGDGDVVYENDRIIHVGNGWIDPVDETVDAGNALVVPGFIDLNAISDLDHAILDSWAPDDVKGGHLWSETYFRQCRHDVFTLEERIFIREYAIVQLLRHGITTCMPIAAETHSAWAETMEEMDGMAIAARRLGIRAYLGPSFRGGINVVREDGSRDVMWDLSEGKRGLEAAVSFLTAFDDRSDDLVHGVLLPCRIETLTLDQMRATARAAKMTGVPVRLHCLQDRFEVTELRRRHDQTVIELLRETGLLETRLLLPHGIYLGGYPRDEELFERELQDLADAGVSVVHCPLTSVRYGVVLDSFDRYRAAGINIALGSDSYPPDLVRGMDIGNNVAKVLGDRLDAGSAADYFRAATLGGAKALGRTDIGRLCVGAQADLIVFDLNDPCMGVVDDPVRTILMNGSARDVKLTVVAGKVVMSNGIVPGVDTVSMNLKAQALFERMREAYTERDYLRRKSAELFPPAFARVQSC